MCKWAKDFNKHFSKELVQMADKHMKIWSASLVIREMQIKIMRYHFTHTGVAIIKMMENSKCWWVYREIETLIHCWWGYKIVQLLWSLAVLPNIKNSDSAIPVLSVYLREIKTCVHTKTCTWVFRAPLVTITKKWK